MQDTFTKLFPSYNHAQPTVFHNHKPVSQTMHIYPKRGEKGQALHKIDRQYTRKKDFLKVYHESMRGVAILHRSNTASATIIKRWRWKFNFLSN